MTETAEKPKLGRPKNPVDYDAVRDAGRQGLSQRQGAKAVGISETNFRAHLSRDADFKAAYEAGRQQFEAGLPAPLRRAKTTYLNHLLAKGGLTIDNAIAKVIQNGWAYDTDQLRAWFANGHDRGPFTFAGALWEWLRSKGLIVNNDRGAPSILSGMLLQICENPEKFGLPYPGENGNGASAPEATRRISVTIGSVAKVRDFPSSMTDEEARAQVIEEMEAKK